MGWWRQASEPAVRRPTAGSPLGKVAKEARHNGADVLFELGSIALQAVVLL